MSASFGVFRSANVVPRIRSMSGVLRVSVFGVAPLSCAPSTEKGPPVAAGAPSSIPLPGTFLSYASGALPTLPIAKPRFFSSSATVLARPARGVAL